MNKHIALIYIASSAIIDYISKHPIDWTDHHLAKLGQPGDKRTPAPAIALFFELFASRRALFSQAEYVAYAEKQWRDWFDSLSLLEYRGVRARLGCNFYVSAIDSLHVWAMLVETGQFSSCVIDTALDVVDKTDIIVINREGEVISISLAISSRAGREAYTYKEAHRGVAQNTVMMWLPIDRPKSPGNKRWYRVEDIAAVVERASEYLIGERL